MAIVYKCGVCGTVLQRAVDDCPKCYSKELQKSAKEAHEADKKLRESGIP